MRKVVRLLCMAVIFVLLPQIIHAQEDTVIVPDLTGLNIPQAAAALNKVGLAFGGETPVTPTGGVPENVISGQSVAPGQTAPRGSEITVEVPRTANVILIYDDNDLTMVNKLDARIDYGDLIFSTVQSTQSASFPAARWGNRLRGKQCAQIWSVGRNGAKGLPECEFIQNWLTTTNRSEHFWTAANGVQSFNVIQGGLERAVCQAAPVNSQNQPLRCEFYLPSGQATEVAPFIYFAYKTDKLAIINNTDSQWMPVATTLILNGLADPAPFGKQFNVNAALFGRPQTVARINRLAPKQCLLFVSSAADDDELPQTCDVIATYTVEPAQAWWTANFQTQGADNKQRTCNAATVDRLTLCIMPR